MTNHPTITIAPLSIPGAMSQAAWRCIQQADALFLQTDQSPCARPVLDAGLAYRSMDDLYASAQDFDQLNQAIARRLCARYAAAAWETGPCKPYWQPPRRRDCPFASCPARALGQAPFAPCRKPCRFPA